MYCMYVCMCVCMYICMYVCIFMYVCMVCTCMCVTEHLMWRLYLSLGISDWTSCTIFTKFGTGALDKNLSSKCEFNENWQSDSHTLLWGTNKYLSIISAFLGCFWLNSVQKNPILKRPQSMFLPLGGTQSFNLFILRDTYLILALALHWLSYHGSSSHSVIKTAQLAQDMIHWIMALINMVHITPQKHRISWTDIWLQTVAESNSQLTPTIYCHYLLFTKTCLVQLGHLQVTQKVLARFMATLSSSKRISLIFIK